MSSTMQTTMPNSSAVTAKMKSVCASGRMRLTVPSPGPRPSQPPRENDSMAVSTWKVSPDALSRKRSMRARTCGRNSIGRDDADKPGAAEAHDPEPVQAGDEEQAAPHDGDEHGLAEIGLQDERNDGGGQEQEGQQRARHVLAPRAFREGPGGEHHEGGLHELGRLQAERADHDPAMRALDLGAELERQQDQHHADRIDQQSAGAADGAATGTRP